MEWHKQAPLRNLLVHIFFKTFIHEFELFFTIQLCLKTFSYLENLQYTLFLREIYMFHISSVDIKSKHNIINRDQRGFGINEITLACKNIRNSILFSNMLVTMQLKLPLNF